jgi:cyclopropane fatty-acyl-phospholipid synthase-like methyltransferase
MPKRDKKVSKPRTPRRRARLTAKTADRHVLYEAAVQNVDADLDFFDRVYKSHRGRLPRRIKEDFCGTAALACRFVERRPDNEAWGVDLHRPTLDWGIRHHVSRLGRESRRLHLLERDVREVTRPPVELVSALNFSYYTFKTRRDLRRYFETARRSLTPDGLLVLDAFGGTEAMDTLLEDRNVEVSWRPDGTPVPSFTYVWEQARFNVLTHDILCHIHFKFRDRTRMNRAFTYDWRMWTLPELQELLLEAGFRSAEVYLEGWDEEEDDTDGIFRRRKKYDNMEGWIAYVVGSR